MLYPAFSIASDAPLSALGGRQGVGSGRGGEGSESAAAAALGRSADEGPTSGSSGASTHSQFRLAWA